MAKPTSLEDDLRAIQTLNQQDVRAVMTSDIDTITSQWTDDFVVLSAGSIVRGRAANTEIAERGRAQILAMEPVDCTVDFQEIKVFGEYAFEWGTYRGSVRPRAGGQTVSYSGSRGAFYSVRLTDPGRCTGRGDNRPGFVRFRRPPSIGC